MSVELQAVTWAATTKHGTCNIAMRMGLGSSKDMYAEADGEPVIARALPVLADVDLLSQLDKTALFAGKGPVTRTTLAHAVDSAPATVPRVTALFGADGCLPGLDAAQITSKNVMSLLLLPAELNSWGIMSAHIDASSFVLRKNKWRLCNVEHIAPLGGLVGSVSGHLPLHCDHPAALAYISHNIEAQALLTLYGILSCIAQAVDPSYKEAFVGCIDAGVMLPTTYAYQTYRELWHAFLEGWTKHAEELARLAMSY